MANSKNQGRMAQDMKRELIGIIGQMKDPRLAEGLLTVTRLDVTPDLDVAKVHISVMGRKDGPEGAVAALNKASGHVRTEISRTSGRPPGLYLWWMRALPMRPTSTSCWQTCRRAQRPPRPPAKRSNRQRRGCRAGFLAPRNTPPGGDHD